MTGLLGQLEPGSAGPGHLPGRFDRLGGKTGGVRGGGGNGGSETHRARSDGADPHGEVVVVDRALEPTIMQTHLLRADAFDPQLGMPRPEPTGLIERGVAQGVQPVGAERAGRRVRRGHGSEVRRAPASPNRLGGVGRRGDWMGDGR